MYAKLQIVGRLVSWGLNINPLYMATHSCNYSSSGGYRLRCKIPCALNRLSLLEMRVSKVRGSLYRQPHKYVAIKIP